MSLPAENMTQAPASELTVVPSTTQGAPAGFWIRVAAYMIDYFIIGAIMTPIYFVAFIVAAAVTGAAQGAGQPVSDEAAGAMLMMAYLFLAPVAMAAGWLYYGLFQKYKGGTPGKLALGLRVVHAETGQFLTFWHSVGRIFAYVLSAIPLYVGFMMVGFRSDKRGLHDLVASTRVIKK